MKYKIEDFLENRKYITKKQSEFYLKTGYLQTNNKKSIQKSFERHYTTFKWLRKKKGQPLMFELGEPRLIDIDNDKRHSYDYFVKSAHHAIHNTLIDMAQSKNEDDDMIAWMTPLHWMGCKDLIPIKFIELCSDEYESDYKSDNEHEKNPILREYIRLRKRFASDIFKKVKRYFDFKTVPALKVEYGSRLLNDFEIKQYENFKEKLRTKYGYVEPIPFRRQTEEMILWADAESKYIKDELDGSNIYTVYQINLINFLDKEYVSDPDPEKFKLLFKDKMDKNLIDRECKYIKKRQLNEELIDIESNKIKKCLMRGEVFVATKSMDNRFGFGSTSKENVRLYDNKRMQIEAQVRNLKSIPIN